MTGSLVKPGQDSKDLTEESYVEEHRMTSWNWEEKKKIINQVKEETEAIASTVQAKPLYC